jgi:hypothetical protein
MSRSYNRVVLSAGRRRENAFYIQTPGKKKVAQNLFLDSGGFIMFSSLVSILRIISGSKITPISFTAALMTLVLCGLVGLTGATQAKSPQKQASTAQPPSQPYPYQMAMGDCAPWDGPAVRLFLAQKPLIPNKDGYFQPNSPFINLGIWTHQPELNKWLSFEAYQDRLGSVSVCTKHNACEPVEAEIRFTEFSNQRIAGTLKLKASRLNQPATHFKAQTIPFTAQYFMPKRPVLCG